MLVMKVLKHYWTFSALIRIPISGALVVLHPPFCILIILWWANQKKGTKNYIFPGNINLSIRCNFVGFITDVKKGLIGNLHPPV